MSLDFNELEDISGTPLDRRSKAKSGGGFDTAGNKHNYMSVRLDRLDMLLNLVGELVITQSTVINNPEVTGLNIESFEKASRQLKKLTDELQDIVMSIRMLPLSATFLRLERIVRDICKKTGKKAELVISGEETELDKNIIDNLSDPLMHIIRNAIDHGIETEQERFSLGKPPVGKITIDAQNAGGDVIITISDDGKGLDKNALINKGIERGLITKPAGEVTDKEAYNLIFLPGFSTRDTVTEFSGRGVGMDVVLNNIHLMGGQLSVDSKQGEGMTVQIRIPLTLVITAGMLIEVGKNVFIVPVSNIVHSLKPQKQDIVKNPDGSEMALVDGQCYKIIKLNELFGIDGAAKALEDGMLMRVDSGKNSYCLFIDRLIGEQQIVIKPIPFFITKALGSLRGISGCTILGDGSVSLILDINSLNA
jgi:two-component system chemotaxis sensor kinase CheA